MNINVKYFGRLADIAGKNNDVVKLESDSLDKLLIQLKASMPTLKEEVYAIFVNNKKAEDINLLLKENDEICLMPPFAGG